MATQIDGAAADGKHITVNVTFTDLKRSFVLELENSVLHHKEMQPMKDADVTVRLTKEFWLQFLVEAGVGERPRLLRRARHRRQPVRAACRC